MVCACALWGGREPSIVLTTQEAVEWHLLKCPKDGGRPCESAMLRFSHIIAPSNLRCPDNGEGVVLKMATCPDNNEVQLYP